MSLARLAGLLEELLDATPREPGYHWRISVLTLHLQYVNEALRNQERTNAARFLMNTARAFSAN